MPGFTKLFSDIIHSTIWREDNKTRIVWVTMLAMADSRGEVHASVPGLADAARVDLDDCVEALDKLKAPDEWSRSKEYEGRRVEEIDGGWLLLNHARYKKKLSDDDKKEQNRIRQKRHREKQKASRVTSRNVTQRNAMSRMSRHTYTDTYTDTDTDTEVVPKEEAVGKKETNGITRATRATRARSKNKRPTEYPDDFCLFWDTYPKKVGKKAALKAWVAAKIDLPTSESLCDAIKSQMSSEQWTRENGQYIPNPATWLNQGRWEDSMVIPIQREPRGIADGWIPPSEPIRTQEDIDRMNREYEEEKRLKKERLGENDTQRIASQ